MSSKDDPFGPDGRTVVKPVREHGAATRVRSAAEPNSASRSSPGPADATVIGSKSAQARMTGRAAQRTVLDQAQARAAPSRGSQAVTFEQLLAASNRIDHQSANPILSAATPVLVLLGHLRQVPAAIEPAAMANHLSASMDDFDRKLALAGVDEADARIARYVLCEMVDDIIQTLPGFAQSGWIQKGMLSRFFHANAAGVGFFDALNSMLADPEDHMDMLELMHVCLSLGFEGQYRRISGTGPELERVRRDVYETLRYFRERPGGDISPQWQGIATRRERSGRRVPLWAVAAALCAVVAGAFFEMRSLLTGAGEALAAEILALDPARPVTIQHVSLAPVAETAPTPVIAIPESRDVQLDRIRAALQTEIAAGKLSVDAKGQFIVVEINNLQLFPPGRATLKPEFDALVGPIAAALSAESGPITIVGHTDSDKPGRGSAFKSNFDLSVARAKAVEKVFSGTIADPARFIVAGKGEDEPIADNAKPEGRARNRRVDLMVGRGAGP